MTHRLEFQPGITTLLRRHSHGLRGARVALVSHSAAVDRRGTSSLELLLHSRAPRKVVAWAPEEPLMNVMLSKRASSKVAGPLLSGLSKGIRFSSSTSSRTTVG